MGVVLLGLIQALPVFLDFVKHMPAHDDIPAYDGLAWHPLEILDLMHFKESIMLYGLHSPFVKEMLNN